MTSIIKLEKIATWVPNVMPDEQLMAISSSRIAQQSSQGYRFGVFHALNEKAKSIG